MTDTTPDRPSSFPWPPVLLIWALLVGYFADRWVLLLPIPFAETGLMRMIGWLLVALGAGLVLWTAIELRAAGTTIRPDRGSRSLVTDGPFAWSRNPIYLGEALGLLGLAILLNKSGFLLTFPIFIFAITVLAIKREEAYLAARFGEAWSSYAERVGRWL